MERSRRLANWVLTWVISRVRILINTGIWIKGRRLITHQTAVDMNLWDVGLRQTKILRANVPLKVNLTAVETGLSTISHRNKSMIWVLGNKFLSQSLWMIHKVKKTRVQKSSGSKWKTDGGVTYPLMLIDHQCSLALLIHYLAKTRYSLGWIESRKKNRRRIIRWRKEGRQVNRYWLINDWAGVKVEEVQSLIQWIHGDLRMKRWHQRKHLAYCHLCLQGTSKGIIL